MIDSDGARSPLIVSIFAQIVNPATKLRRNPSAQFTGKKNPGITGVFLLDGPWPTYLQPRPARLRIFRRVANWAAASASCAEARP